MRASLVASLVLSLSLSGAVVAQEEGPLREARRLFGTGALEAARAEVEAVLASDPGDGEANLLMARIALGLGDLDTAERHVALSRAGTQRERFMAPQTEGMVRLYRRDFAGAVESFSDALQRAPRYGPAFLGRAQARAFLGDLQAALEDLDAAGQASQPQPAARLLLGELLLVQGRLGEGMQVLRSLAEAPAEIGGIAGENAGLYVNSFTGDPVTTEERARRWVERFPNRAASHFWHGLVKLSRGEVDEAIRRFHVALAVDELHAPSYLALRAAIAPERLTVAELVGPPLSGIEHTMTGLREALANGDFDVAEQGAYAVLEARPLFVPARVLLVDVQRGRQDLVGVLAATVDLLFLVPEMPSLRAQRAAIARDLGAFELAEQDARAAIVLAPSDGTLEYLLATVLAAAGRPDEAVAACRAAIADGYDSAALQVTLGNAYRELQQLPEAVAALERAVELDPSSAEQVATFALAAMAGADADRLQALLEPWVAEHPDATNSAYALGMLYQRSGQLQRAVELLAAVAEQRPQDAQVQYNLSLVYRRLGNEEQAAAHTARFTELKAVEQEEFDRSNAAYRLRNEATAALTAGDAAGALSAVRRLLDMPGSEPPDRALLARALAVSGDQAAAAVAWAGYLQLVPHDAAALCDAAATVLTLGDADRAAALQNRAAALGWECGPS